MRQSYHRLDGGTPLRQAMKDGGWKLQSLAAMTRQEDPEGRGVSFQLIAFLASRHPWGRETTSQRSAELIAAALGFEVTELFSVPADSAHDGEPVHTP